MQLVDGLISVVVTPSNEEFEFEWKFNGELVANESDATFSLPLSVSGNDQVEVIVSSDCGAARANIFVLTFTPTSKAPIIGKL